MSSISANNVSAVSVPPHIQKNDGWNSGGGFLKSSFEKPLLCAPSANTDSPATITAQIKAPYLFKFFVLFVAMKILICVRVRSAGGGLSTN